MLPKKTKHSFYVMLLLVFTIFGVSTKATTIVWGTVVNFHTSKVTITSNKGITASKPELPSANTITQHTTNSNTAAPLFATILQGADEEITCSIDGSTLAKYFLCGTSDYRTLTLSSSGTNYSWEKLSDACSFVGTDSCPVFNSACNGDWEIQSTTATFDLDASDTNVSGEYRVRVDSGNYYYFRVSSNPLSPQLNVQDIICGEMGKIEVTNVPEGYEYSLNSPSGPFQTDPFYDITTPGTYQVFTRLQNASASACIFPSEEVTIVSLTMMVSASKTDITCSGEKGSISVNVDNVPGFYSYRLVRDGVTMDTYGPNSANSHTFNNVGSGTYTVVVEANTSCTETITTINGDSITIGENLVPLEATAFTTDSFGCGATAVPVTLDVSGGTAPYQYSLDNGATFSTTFSSNTVFNVSASGTYSILITDASGCSKEAAVTVADIPPPVFTITTTDANCGGATNGEIDVVVTNSNGHQIIYSIDGGNTYQTSSSFSNLAPASYSVVLQYEQDSFSCTTVPQTVQINTPSSTVGNALITATPTCVNPNGGEITFSGVSGGVAPYEYSIGAGFSSTTMFTNLSVGTYSPQIRDANGCVSSLAPIVFNTLDIPTDIDFAISAKDCITSTATVTLNVTGGASISSYEIRSPITVSNGVNPVFTGLGIGSYTFYVTDTNGCTYTESFAITEITSVRVAAQKVNDITCFGNSDGEGRFVVNDFTRTYSYQIDGGATVSGQTLNEITVAGLAAGVYAVTVTDEETNCTATASITIDSPLAALAQAPAIVQMTCVNNNRGAVTANASGGWGGYLYRLIQPDGSILGPRTSAVFSGLTQVGIYTLITADREGCEVADNFTLTALQAPTLALDGASDLCYDTTNGATLIVTANGGDGAYEYQLNSGGWTSSATFSGLGPGNYTIAVRDGNDCISTITQRIRAELTSVVTLREELRCSLTGSLDAEIFVQLSNGNRPYASYEVRYNNGSYAAPVGFSGTNFTYTTPNDGTYQFRITDNFGCQEISNTVTVSPVETIAAAAIVTNPICGDINSGSVTLVPDTTVGIPPYDYSTDDSTYTSIPVFGNLAPGSYTYFVRDARGCKVSVPFTIGAVVPAIDALVSVTPTVCSAGASIGEITINSVSNGVAPFTFNLFDASGVLVSSAGPLALASTTFTGLRQGNYTLITNDASGCQDIDEIIVDQNEIDLVPVSVTSPPDCTTAITYIVNIVGGTAPYQIGLVGETLGAPNVDADTHDFTGSIVYGITYFVEVIDAGGCRYIEEIAPISGPNPLAVSTTTTAAACTSPANGTLNYTLSGYTAAAVSVVITNTTTGAIIYGPTSVATSGPLLPITNLEPGAYQISVAEDITGCAASALFTIIQDIPTTVVDTKTNANCNSPNGQFILRGVGGTGNYVFALVTAGGTAPISTSYSNETTYEVAPGSYDIYVRDANGCGSVLSNQAISIDAGVSAPTVNVVNQCSAVSSYTIAVTSPLSINTTPENAYQYNIGSGYQSSPNFIVPNAGEYTITVRNGNGCTNTVTAQVFDFFSISASATSLPSCNNADGSITVATTGGSGTFRYVLDDGSGTLISQDNDPIFTAISPGDYTITVTDLLSNTVPLCTDSTTVIVDTVLTPILSGVAIENISCNGASDGSAVANLDASTATDGPFLYTLYDALNNIVVPAQNTGIFENLAVGTYEVGIVSNRGCESRSSAFQITEPLALQIAANATAFSCDSSSSNFSISTLSIYHDTNGDGTGNVTGTAPYSYAINDGSTLFNGTNYQTSSTFTLVDTGMPQTIIASIKDANGCETQTTITIQPPSVLSFTFQEVSPLQCDTTGTGVTSGSYEIIINEGMGNYGVSLLPLGSASEKLTNGADRVLWDFSVPGDYIFAVRDIDNGGCLYITPIVQVPEFNTISATINEVTPVQCFGSNDGEISIEISGYSGVYNYEVFSKDAAGALIPTGVLGSFDTIKPITSPEVISGLPAGNLIVLVQAVDAPFCDVWSTVTTIHSPDRALTAVAQETANVTCAFPGIGEITVNADGGWGGYSFALAQETTAGVFTQITAANSVNSFNNLAAGNYEITVSDASGCSVIIPMQLAIPIAIEAEIQIDQPLVCPGANDGILSAFNVRGGEDIDGDGEEYLFQLNRLDTAGTVLNTSGLQESAMFPNLPAGNYTITVYDGWSCAFTTPQIQLQDPEAVRADLRELTAPGCGDAGEMELSITNPIAGVEYFYRRTGTTDAFVSFGGTGVTTAVITILDVDTNPGPYQFDVQNTNGCPFQQSNEIAMEKALPLVIALDLVDANIKCQGEETGIIRSQAFGGVGNYRYTLVNSDLGFSSTGSIATPMAADIVQETQDSGIFRRLPPGTYYVYAESSACIAISEVIEISPKDPLVLEELTAMPISCATDKDGQIRIVASGGTGKIRFSISETLSEFFEGEVVNGMHTMIFTNLPEGTFEVIIQDEVGCSIIEEVSIVKPNELLGALATSTPETCINTGDGYAKLTVTGGTPFKSIQGDTYYETLLIGPEAVSKAVYTPNPALEFNFLLGGVPYVAMIRDASGCETSVVFEIPLGVDLTIDAEVLYGCEGIYANTTTQITLADMSIVNEVLFSLDVNDISVADTLRTFGDLAEGQHTVYAFHSNGCSAEINFEVLAYEPLTLSIAKTAPNEITAVATGGYGAYEFFFQEESQGGETVFTLNEDAEITVRVVDASGCELQEQMQFDFTGMIELPQFFTPDGDGLNDTWAPENRTFYPNIEVIIYDRYGRVVAQLDDVKSWDGTYEGTSVPTGDYWYVVHANDAEKQRYVGHFTLLR